MSNKERIKNMSAWELAEFLYNVSNGATKFTVCNDICDKCECSEAYCISEIGEWLNNDEQ